MRIAKLAKIGGAVVIGGLLALAATGWQTISELKVGGPHYERIILGKDLLADILPPPEYIIEPFLEATLALNEPAQAKTHKERLVALRKDYDTRHEFWLKQKLPPALAQAFLQDGHAAALRFWEMLETEFFPALESGDGVKARAAHQKLRVAYNEHRAKIDTTITEATIMVQDIEVTAASRVSRSIWLTSLLALALLSAMIAAIAATLKGVIAPISHTARSMRALADGDTGVEFPGLGRDDEIGDMAGAAGIFRQNALARTELEREQVGLRRQEMARQAQLEHVLEDFQARVAILSDALENSTRAAPVKEPVREPVIEPVKVPVQEPAKIQAPAAVAVTAPQKTEPARQVTPNVGGAKSHGSHAHHGGRKPKR